MALIFLFSYHLFFIINLLNLLRFFGSPFPVPFIKGEWFRVSDFMLQLWSEWNTIMWRSSGTSLRFFFLQSHILITHIVVYSTTNSIIHLHQIYHTLGVEKIIQIISKYRACSRIRKPGKIFYRMASIFLKFYHFSSLSIKKIRGIFEKNGGGGPPITLPRINSGK